MEPNPWAFGWGEVTGLANLGVLAFATFFAIRTVSRIRGERFTTKEAETAEECLTTIYEARVAFRRIRSIWGHETELSSRDEYINRCYSEPVFNKITEIQARVKAYLGQRPFELLDELSNLRTELMITADDLWGGNPPEGKEEFRTAMNFVMRSGRSNDEFDARFRSLETEAESILLPKIGRKES